MTGADFELRLDRARRGPLTIPTIQAGEGEQPTAAIPAPVSPAVGTRDDEAAARAAAWNHRQLLLERTDDLVLIQSQCVGILSQKPTAKTCAWQAIELIVLHGLEEMAGDFGLGGYPFELQTEAQALAAECVAN
jgi:hypothetical protein